MSNEEKTTESPTGAQSANCVSPVVRRGVPDHEFPHICNLTGDSMRPMLECSCGATYAFGSTGAGWQDWLKKHGSECV